MSAVPQFHALRIKDVRRETDEATSLAFEVPVELRDAYSYVQGQYLTLKADVAGEELRRPYSICSGLDDGELRVAVKRLPGGRFSNYVNDEAHPGATIDVMTPLGTFFVPVEQAARRRYVGFAGGSGITPFMSIIKTVLAREPHSEFTLFYGNRLTSTIMFREALGDLKDRHLGRLRVFHVLSDEQQETPLFCGLLDEAKIRELVGALVDVEETDHFFICGPGPMMDAAQKVLRETGVEDARVKLEIFGTPAPHASAQPQKKNGAHAGRIARAGVLLHGRRTEVEVPFEGTSVLDAALARNLDLPFACKGGVCCTCKAKLVEGEVRMDVAYGLEPEEIEAGYILTCQSHPVTDRIVVDYDDR